MIRAIKSAFVHSNQKWVCGQYGTANECRSGPDKFGNCRVIRSCTPLNDGNASACGRTEADGGPCDVGPDANGACGSPVKACQPVSSVRAMQRRSARWIVTVALGILAVSLTFAGGTKLLMPGPMATPHGSVENCSSCHSNVKAGPMGWVHNVFAAADPRKDSMACVTCHKIGATAINPHSADMAMLENATNRMQKKNTAAANPVDLLREAAFPIARTFPKGVFCQTCHKEHKGEQADLKLMPDNRCQTCHTMKIHSFGTDHPDFESYPFKRRTRVFFDHSSHFGTHFPELLKKPALANAIPNECSNCHTVGSDNRQMDVKPFKQVCSACHVGQIVGTERPEGPKGITLLALPGLDVDTLEEKGADIGEWPAESDAELTPFMELLIGRDDKRRKILKTVKNIDLLDLSSQSDETIAAVEAFAWEVKDLIFTYANSKPSVVLKRLTGTTGRKIEPELITKLIASMPRDVLMSAQHQWLPNLEAELNARKSETEDNADSASADKDKDEGENEEDAEEDDNSDESDEEDQADSGKDEDEDDEDADDEDADNTEDPAEPRELAVDAESWTEFGGWYRQDYAILYRPRGHADEFFKTWLDFSGRVFTEDENNPAASAFSLLTSKDAQGQCTKCHSVDAASDGTRRINWMPSRPPLPAGRFTQFSHSPHLSIVGKLGCLTCHKLDPTAKTQDTYKKNNPAVFESNFGSIKKDACTTCHKQSAAREDCLLCHVYHVNKVATPVPVTTLPNK